MHSEHPDFTAPNAELEARITESLAGLTREEKLRMIGGTHPLTMALPEKGIPAFTCGFGLSYTRFAYENLQLSAEQIHPDETLRVTFDIINTGKRPGTEAAQLYLHDCECSLPRPFKELKGFAKVHLQPGEKQTVSLPITEGHLRFYDPDRPGWIIEPGVFQILIGASSEDIRLTGYFSCQ